LQKCVDLPFDVPFNNILISKASLLLFFADSTNMIKMTHKVALSNCNKLQVDV